MIHYNRTVPIHLHLNFKIAQCLFFRIIITARVRSTTGGYVFTGAGVPQPLVPGPFSASDPRSFLGRVVPPSPVTCPVQCVLFQLLLGGGGPSQDRTGGNPPALNIRTSDATPRAVRLFAVT